MVVVDTLTQLAVAARDGNRVALAAFVQQSQADIWRFCSYLLGAPAADDAAQETFERTIGSLRTFRGEVSAKTWLLAIARRTCADVIRRSTRRRYLFERASRQAIETSAPLGGTAEVDALLDVLDEPRRQAFVLTQLLGLSYDEAADVCGCPIGTIRSRVARARAALVDAVGPAAAADG
jgi:RNA polymerase sigma-70 factor (ECF subfamily)